MNLPLDHTLYGSKLASSDLWKSNESKVLETLPVPTEKSRKRKGISKRKKTNSNITPTYGRGGIVYRK